MVSWPAAFLMVTFAIVAPAKAGPKTGPSAAKKNAAQAATTGKPNIRR
jgi:hypothetical protein